MCIYLLNRPKSVSYITFSESEAIQSSSTYMNIPRCFCMYIDPVSPPPPIEHIINKLVTRLHRVQKKALPKSKRPDGMRGTMSRN